MEAETPARLVMPKAVKVADLVRGLAEELGVRRVRAGVAALDVVEAELVEHVGDGRLVLDGEVDAGGLRAVAEGGVEEVEAFAVSQRISSQRNVDAFASLWVFIID